MKIESIIRRATGSTVNLGNNTYRFLPGDDGRHVCNVDNEDHIDRLLSIKEGFRAVEDDEVKIPAKAQAKSPVTDQAGEQAADTTANGKAPAKPRAPRKPKNAPAPVTDQAGEQAGEQA